MTRRTIRAPLRAVSCDSARQKSREPGSNQEALKSKKLSSHAFPTKPAAWSVVTGGPSCCKPPIAPPSHPPPPFPVPHPPPTSAADLHGIGRPAFRTSRLGRSAPSRRHGRPRRPPAAGCGLGPAGPLQLRLAPVVSATEWPPRRHPDPLRPLAPIRSAVAHTREPRAATLRQEMGLVGYAVGVGARASATCRRFSDMVGPPRHWSAIIWRRRDQGQVRVRSALTRKQAAALLASRAPGQEVAEESRPDYALPMTARRRIQ